MSLLAAIVLGLAGSLHCIGMCGPIALALPFGSAGVLRRLFLILIYNSGRVITYVVMGVAAGITGISFSLAGTQQWVSVAAGVLLLLVMLVPYLKSKFRFPALHGRAFSLLKKALGRWLNRKGGFASLATGMLNGLLPCGLVYIALAGALATGDIPSAMLFMAVFGLGTLPAMIALMFTVQRVNLRWRNRFRSAVPVMVTLTAVLLILRGLNLGIPYVSPQVSETSATCCSHSTDNDVKPTDGEPGNYQMGGCHKSCR